MHRRQDCSPETNLNDIRGPFTGLMSTFFSSILSWLLYPCDCVLANEESFTSIIHGHFVMKSLFLFNYTSCNCHRDERILLSGTGASPNCNPWGVPEFGITLLSTFIAAVFVACSLTASFFCFDFNPLSQSVGASCTGRVLRLIYI